MTDAASDETRTVDPAGITTSSSVPGTAPPDQFDGSFLEAGDNTVSAEDTGHCRYFQWAIATEAMNQYLFQEILIQ